MRIGILGGTFNPIHMGHMVLAEEAIGRLGLNRVIFVPARRPPHKEIGPEAAAEERLAMVRLSIKGERRLFVSTYELDKKGISYSIDTLKFFRARYGARARLFFITGSDSLRELSSWKEIKGIFGISRFIMAARPGYPIRGVPDRVEVLKMPAIGISSSDIRRRVKEGRSIRYLVDEKVRRYIERKGLYRRS